MYAAYTVFIVALVVVMSPVLLYQALRYRKYIANFKQRMGYLPVSFNLDGDRSIWIHAVSVGEVLSARPLFAAVRARYPRVRLLLSTTTRTGQEMARRQDVDAVFYFPFDWTFAVRRVLNVVRPRMFVMVETEIWPNLLRECRQRGIQTVMVNGRISYRSYPRYRLVRPFMRRVLATVDRFCVQGEETARRLTDLGVDTTRITVTGSLKFDALDLSPPSGDQRVLRYFRLSPGRPVIVAGSTLAGEEEPVIWAFTRVRTTAPSTLLVIAPRHPERFDEVYRLCRTHGFETIRRTELPIDAEPRADVVVLDTIGELALVYQVATVVFVGGSLVPAGGHNILEPALYGKPVVFGPYMQNFADIAATFVTSGAAAQVRSAGELESTLLALSGDPVRRARIGAAARALVEANRGASDRTMGVIAGLLPSSDRGGSVRPFRVVQ